MKPISGKDFAKILERNGWKLLRIHGNRELKIGLLKHLLSLANFTESDLK